MKYSIVSFGPQDATGGVMRPRYNRWGRLRYGWSGRDRGPWPIPEADLLPSAWLVPQQDPAPPRHLLHVGEAQRRHQKRRRWLQRVRNGAAA